MKRFIVLIAGGCLLILAFVLLYFFYGNNSEIKISSCDEYLAERECLDDFYNVSLNEKQTGWRELNCGLEDVNCKCSWNEEQKCQISMAVKDEPIPEENITKENDNYYDLEATNLTLTSGGCSTNNVTNNTFCNMTILGKIKNSGTTDISDKFMVHFVDGTDYYHIINLFSVEEEIIVGTEKEFSFTYTDITQGEYWIQINVDPKNSIEEIDERNNKITQRIKIKK